ncbi:TetR family transcriptional regulator [Venatoribacter cucullus]|uniref:TetR family transcriptional regulator n=1 Tax=Venatoribacter cucullus TaxID=2661630 RepID=A0A9X7UWQ6_9GAMM|nr:TetR/AcrR family transcriptional regulator [Venatoribacter cucullus]QQD20748.1 TetR family transcriptional regulator [Oceanospirillaceae bacterium ASx5O]QQD23453.1 TetR family transcriptional regulator [Venatoribacter cucullus]
MSKELDKRVERSRRQLMTALLELMQQQPYRKISVAHICEHSGVARPTFYLHYRSKDDLLRGYIESMFLQFYEQVDEYLTSTPDADPIIAEIMFRQWSERADIARLLVKDDIEALMLSEFKRYVDRIMQRFISAHKVPVRDTSLLPYVVDFLAGASFMVIVRWIKDDFPVDAKEMGSLYANLVRPGLLQVLLSGKL